jgi:hypothetical protein
LKKGGVFTYYSDEINEFGAVHLRKLQEVGFEKKNIRSKVTSISPLKVANTGRQIRYCRLLFKIKYGHPSLMCVESRDPVFLVLPNTPKLLYYSHSDFFCGFVTEWFCI